MENNTKYELINKRQATQKRGIFIFTKEIDIFWQLFLFLIICYSCTKPESHHDTLFQKTDSQQTGITFQNTLKPTEELNILDYLYFFNGGGVAVGDINNDDLVDIFFTSNQGKNKLYLNKGNWKFEDITEKSGVSGSSDWNTGTVMADVNGDGFLDIYVCAVVGLQGLKGKNELYINKGNGTFVEKAAAYGIDFENYSTSAAFFDYDNDGDLDLYLLNHAVHTQHSFGKASLRNTRHKESGDKLMRNDNGYFTDVSEEAGIYGGGNGYGLGIATADFNNDGFVDMYVSNDFHEDDYYYLNQGDGTFKEQLKLRLGHTSRFSMGNDVSDINQDGYVDLITLDMTPEDEAILKASAGDETTDMLRMRIERLGYHYQFARNMLHINQEGDFFTETALQSGVSATDWSWSALFADYNLDAEQDLFISNGIPKRPNDLDYIKYISNKEIQKQLNTSKLVDAKALELMPSGAVQNAMFEGQKGIQFKDQSATWLPQEQTASTGSAYADFDNDGDLDLVMNNINGTASLYENKADVKGSGFLKLKFRFKDKNPFGIGTKVISYHRGIAQYKQLFVSKGFQSSSEPIIHFGYGDTAQVDSLKIIWPDNTIQIAENVKTNQTLTIQLLHKRDAVDYRLLFPKSNPWFKKIDSLPGLRYTHKENSFTDVNRQKLIPYQISDKGPATAIGDLNGDGKDDIFFGSSRNEKSVLFFQTDNGFEENYTELFEEDKLQEDVFAVIEDFTKDGKNDLMVATAGGEFYGKSKNLLNRFYINSENGLQKTSLSELYMHESVIKPYDVDQDGDVDMFMGGYAVANDFGKAPNSCLMINDAGSFSVEKNKELSQTGMITDAIWTDFDADGIKDLVIVGEWMTPKFFRNTKGNLIDVTDTMKLENLKGLWQSIVAFDIDQDGDLDYLMGNYGLNTKLNASVQNPLRLYYSDFDENGSSETILAVYKKGKYYTALGLDELSAQLNYLKKKFTSYKDFAGKTVEEVMGADKLAKAQLLTVEELRSGYLKNDKGTFSFVPFDENLQVAPIMAMLRHDFDHDHKEEVLIAGNYFGVIPYHGRFDGFGGAIIENENSIVLASGLGLNLSQKSVRGINILNFANKEYVVITINDGKPEIYEFLGKKKD